MRKAVGSPFSDSSVPVRQRRCVMKTQRSFARGWQLYAVSALMAAAVFAALAARAPRAVHARGQETAHAPAPAPSATPDASRAVVPKPVKIDLAAAVKVPLPAGMRDLTPAVFKTSDGKEGWVVRVPGGRPLATPAYADGM